MSANARSPHSLSTVQLAYAARQLRDKIGALPAEPIAITGMGCRFPASTRDPEGLWTLLRTGRDCVTEIPRERWDVESYFDPVPGTPGKMYTRHGCFIDGVDQFDPQFFQISPREAESMDPQQRLLLTVCWEALEHAGMAPPALRGSAAGIFVGISGNDYADIIRASGQIDSHTGAGAGISMAAGRVAHALGLEGPALAVDTACSSSLVATHLACQALRGRECDVALAGGINLVLAPLSTIVECQMRMLSPRGRCSVFDESADGFVRGEGCGVVVLKRLSDALADGDLVLAVIRGSAVLHDGHSSGLMVPNGRAQERAIRTALRTSGVDAAQIHYIEAHGTGTALGDPIEMEALGRVFAPGRGADNRLLVGSIKSNLGHTEAAAGITGLMKAVLALHKEEIPPNLHFHGPNPRIRWSDLPVTVPTALTPWTAGAGRRLAGISSFGFSGTIAHLVLEEAPLMPRPEARSSAARMELLPLSARDPAALRELTGRIAAQLQSTPEVTMADVCEAAQRGRAQLPQRVAFVADSRESGQAQLVAFAAGQLAPGAVSSVAPPGRRPLVAFLFSHQTVVPVGVGRQLFDAEPIFRANLERCHEIMRPLLPRGLLDVLYPAGPTAPADDGLYIPPLLFALQVALVELWRAWGIEPAAVLGHGLGEYAAAFCAGVFSLEDALRLVVRRAQLLSSVPKAANPRDGALGAPGEQAARIQLSVPRLPLLSGVTGAVLSAEVSASAYWDQEMRPPVRRDIGLQALAQLGAQCLVEIGPPGPDLTRTDWAAIGIADERRWLPSLHAERPDRQQLLESLAALYAAGAPVRWDGLTGRPPGYRVRLPTYPFRSQRYWLDRNSLQADSADASVVSPLLGRRIDLAGSAEVRFESVLRRRAPDYLEHHRLFGQVILPAAVYLEAALEAGAALAPGPWALAEVNFGRPAIVAERSGCALQVAVSPHADGYRFQVYCRSSAAEPWREAASGRLVPGTPGPAQLDAATQALALPEEVAADAYYAHLEHGGLEYGPSFRALVSLRRRDGEAWAYARLPAALSARGYALHPVLLDAGFQALGTAFPKNEVQLGSERVWVPVGLARLQVYSPVATELWLHIQREDDAGTYAATIKYYTRAGSCVAEARGLRLGEVPRAALTAISQPIDKVLYEVKWRPAPPAALPPDDESVAPAELVGADVSALTAPAADYQSPAPRQAVLQHWLVIADAAGIGEALAGELRARGRACTVVRPTTLDAELALPLAEMNRDRLLTAVVYLGSLDAPAADEQVSNQFAEAGANECVRVLRLLHTLTAAKLSPRLFLVTRGAAALPGERPAGLLQAPLHGMALVIRYELPELGCRCVDLAPDQTDVAALAAELLTNGPEDRVALRAGGRLLPRLVSYAAPAAAPFRCRADATYLVAGGLGGLGLLTAQWLAHQGARNLLLIGRSPPTAAAQQALEKLRALGVTVHAAQADITDAAQLEAVLAHGTAGRPPLRGVVHAAGVLDDARLSQLSDQQLQRVLSPKLQGSWLLQKLTRSAALDFFVMFSSAASLLGNAGQANYVAANMFQDVLAHYLRAVGVPALSINWGPWAEVGAATASAARLQTAGMGLFSREQGLTVLGSVLAALSAGAPPQLGAMLCDWSALARFGAPPAFFGELLGSGKTGAGALPDRAPQRQDLLARLATASAEESHQLFIDHLRHHLSRILGCAPQQPLASTSLLDLGLDSLTAIELKSALLTDLGIDLPLEVLITGASMEDVATALREKVARRVA